MSMPHALMAKAWRSRSWLATLFFILTAGFLDEFSLMNLVKLLSKNADLRAEIRHYEQQYEHDRRTLRQLANSPEAVEKVARVNLLMKTANEDIYVVVEE